jgi:hypothetical protein
MVIKYRPAWFVATSIVLLLLAGHVRGPYNQLHLHSDRFINLESVCTNILLVMA